MRKLTVCICECKAQISFAVTMKLITAFVFATLIVQFHYFLNPKLPASSHLLCLYSSACVGPDRKPHCWFSHDVAHVARYLADMRLIYTFVSINLSIYIVSICTEKQVYIVSNLARYPEFRYSKSYE